MKTAFGIISAIAFFLLSSTFLARDIPDGFAKYKIEAGDVLSKIASRECWDIIKKINRIDPQHLPTGKEILIPIDTEKARRFCPVPKKIGDVKKIKRSIFVFLDSQYFGAYQDGFLLFWGPICSGKKDTHTPTGMFLVQWKSIYWFSKKYDAEMPFAINISSAGYFLHQQSLTGRPSSHGCVRLLYEDAKRLFYWTKKGDPVFIK